MRRNAFEPQSRPAALQRSSAPGEAWVAALAVALVCGSLQACSPDPPVRIGFIGGLSGRVADLGVSGRNGAQLAVETLNAHGSRRYELHVEDDRQDPARASSAVSSLAEQQVDFIVGPMTSAIAVAAVPEANRRHIVMISPTANTDALSGKDDHLFRVIADAPTGARQLAELLHQRGVQRLAVLMDQRNRAYSDSFGRACADRLSQLGGRVTAMLSFESGSNVEFASLARQLLQEHPQHVLIVGSAVDSSLAAQQLRQIDPAVGLSVTPWAASGPLLQLGGRAVEGMLVPQASDQDSHAPAYLEFRRRYRERFGEDPGPPSISTYDAVMLGAEALRRASSPQALREVLASRGTQWPGLQRPLALDAYGDSTNPIYITEVHGGRLVSVRS